MSYSLLATHRCGERERVVGQSLSLAPGVANSLYAFNPRRRFCPRPRPLPPRAPICLPCSETGVCTTRTAPLGRGGEYTGGTTRRGTNVRVRGDTLMTSGRARGRRTVR